MEIFDINGRMVEPVIELVEMPGGAKLPLTGSGSELHEFVWMPEETVGSGVYLVRINGTNATVKVIYLK